MGDRRNDGAARSVTSRASSFIHALTSSPRRYAQLASAGMTTADFEKGRELLRACFSVQTQAGKGGDGGDGSTAEDALRAWLEEWWALADSVFRGAEDRVRLGLDAAPAAPARSPAPRREVSTPRIQIPRPAPKSIRMSPETDLALAILRATPLRAARFLDGLVAEPRLYAALASVGMKDADVQEGCDLLLACFRPPRTSAGEAGEAMHVRRLHALHKWFEAWSEAAKCCIARPSDLLRLGLVVTEWG